MDAWFQRFASSKCLRCFDILRGPGVDPTRHLCKSHSRQGEGHLHVEEMESLVEYVGYQHVYWNLQIFTPYAHPLPSDTESVGSESEA